MNPLLEKLLVLQDRDVRLARLQSELHRIPEEKAHLDQQEQQVKSATEHARSESRRLEVERKKLEMQVSTKEELVRKYKSQLLEIKNNDQFHALQHEIAASEQEIRQVEDVELGLMEQLEKGQADVKRVEAEERERIQQITAQRKDIDQKTVLLEKQVGELKGERARLASEVEEDILARYERIFRSKQNQAVVRISHGMCTGCHLKLTAQEIHNAQSGEGLVTCTNCGRILYWTPE